MHHTRSLDLSGTCSHFRTSCPKHFPLQIDVSKGAMSQEHDTSATRDAAFVTVSENTSNRASWPQTAKFREAFEVNGVLLPKPESLLCRTACSACFGKFPFPQADCGKCSRVQIHGDGPSVSSVGF